MFVQYQNNSDNELGMLVQKESGDSADGGVWSASGEKLFMRLVVLTVNN